MNKPRWPDPVTRWALGELRRHPLQATLLFATLASLSTLLTFVLLLNQGLGTACDRLTAQTAAITLRRAGPGGWLPLPARETLVRLRRIPGVLNPRSRVWGYAIYDDRIVTVVGDTEGLEHSYVEGLSRPGSGQAVIGPGFSRLATGDHLLLRGQIDLDFTVAGRLPGKAALGTVNLVLLDIDDARRLLGVPEGQASDLVLDVFHETESPAVVRDLTAALPWPVRITTRSETRIGCRNELGRIGAPAILAFGPGLAALATLVIAMGVWGYRQRFYLGVLKAMGWRSVDIVRLQLRRALLIGVPALLCGLVGGRLLLEGPGAIWGVRLMPTWPGPATVDYQPAADLVGPMALTAVLIGLPYLTAILWAAWAALKTDPAELLIES